MFDFGVSCSRFSFRSIFPQEFLNIWAQMKKYARTKSSVVFSWDVLFYSFELYYRRNFGFPWYIPCLFLFELLKWTMFTQLWWFWYHPTRIETSLYLGFSQQNKEWFTYTLKDYCPYSWLSLKASKLLVGNQKGRSTFVQRRQPAIYFHYDFQCLELILWFFF